MPKYTFTFFEESDVTLRSGVPLLESFIRNEFNVHSFRILEVSFERESSGVRFECVFESQTELVTKDLMIQEYHGDKPQYYSAIVDSSGVASCFGKGHMLDIAIAITKLRFLATAPDSIDYEFTWDLLCKKQDPEYRLIHGREDR